MAFDEVKRIARLVTGSVLFRGSLGHQLAAYQVIGGSRSIELATTNAVLAAASSQPSAAAQVALRSVLPAIAVDTLARRGIARSPADSASGLPPIAAAAIERREKRTAEASRVTLEKMRGTEDELAKLEKKVDAMDRKFKALKKTEGKTAEALRDTVATGEKSAKKVAALQSKADAIKERIKSLETRSEQTAEDVRATFETVRNTADKLAEWEATSNAAVEEYRSFVEHLKELDEAAEGETDAEPKPVVRRDPSTGRFVKITDDAPDSGEDDISEDDG